MPDHLLIPVEIKNRELDAKLLLAQAAAERGFKVIIGDRHAVEYHLPRAPRGIYFGKDITEPVAPLYERIAGAGHRLVAVDEEALVYYSRDIYRRRRIGRETWRHVAALFAWGPDNADMWRETEGCPEVPIHPTGNPRFDLLRPELRAIHGEEVARLKDRFGDFILVNTNFGHVNSFHPKFLKMPPPEVAARMTNLPRFYDAALSAHRNRIFHEFRTMLPRLAAAFADRPIVLRPHPGESLESWKGLLQGFPNVTVLYDGPVIPWILAAQVVVHNGCTTGLEARMLGKPAIAYRPLRDDAHETALPNEVSHQVGTFDALVAALEAALRGQLTHTPEGEAAVEALLDRFVAARSGPLAAERVAAALVDLPPSRSPWPRRVRARLQLARTSFKVWRKRNRMKQQKKTWRAHSFPPTAAAEIEARLERLARLRPGTRPAAVRPIATNLYALRAA